MTDEARKARTGLRRRDFLTLGAGVRASPLLPRLSLSAQATSADAQPRSAPTSSKARGIPTLCRLRDRGRLRGRRHHVAH